MESCLISVSRRWQLQRLSNPYWIVYMSKSVETHVPSHPNNIPVWGNCEKICPTGYGNEGACKAPESGRQGQGSGGSSGRLFHHLFVPIICEGPRGDGKTAEKECGLELGASASLAPGDFASAPVTVFAGIHNLFLFGLSPLGFLRGLAPDARKAFFRPSFRVGFASLCSQDSSRRSLAFVSPLFARGSERQWQLHFH